MTIAAGPREIEVLSNTSPERDRVGIAVILREVRWGRPRWSAIWLTPLWRQRLDSTTFAASNMVA